MTRQRLRIRAVLGLSLCVDGLEQGSVCDGEAGQLLMDLFGESLPLHQLPEWLRGLTAQDAPTAVGVMRDARSGLPDSLSQSGWTVTYQTWHPATATRPPLPRRLELNKGETRLRLVIDHWTWGRP